MSGVSGMSEMSGKGKTNPSQINRVSGMIAQFLLIQDGIVDCAECPANLAFSFIDAWIGFKVAVGCINEFGEHEIVGIVADVSRVIGCNTWRVSSSQDGYRRLIGATGSPASFVRARLDVMYRNGDFADLCQLPPAVLIMPGTPTKRDLP